MQKQLKLLLENNDVDEIIKYKLEREQKEDCWSTCYVVTNTILRIRLTLMDAKRRSLVTQQYGQYK